MMEATRTTTVTESRRLTHADICEALKAYVLARSQLTDATDVAVRIRSDNSWEAAGKNMYTAVVTLTHATSQEIGDAT